MNKNIDNDFAIDLDMLETPHGIFTSNTYLGLSAREVYEQYLHELENPQPQKPSLEEVVKEQEDKISILVSENELLKQEVEENKHLHSNMIFDIDFRVMDIEDNLGITPMNIFNLNCKGDDFVGTTARMLLEKIKDGNYNDKSEIEAMAERYLQRGRITIEEYDILMKELDKKEAEKNPVPTK